MAKDLPTTPSAEPTSPAQAVTQTAALPQNPAVPSATGVELPLTDLPAVQADLPMAPVPEEPSFQLTQAELDELKRKKALEEAGQQALTGDEMLLVQADTAAEATLGSASGAGVAGTEVAAEATASTAAAGTSAAAGAGAATTVVGMSPWAIGLGSLGVAGAGAAALGGGGGGGSDNSQPAPDTTAPVAPTLALATDTGLSADDGITNEAIVNVSGLEAGASWEYSTNNGDTWTAGSGTSFALNTDGTHSVIARQTDVAGNTSANSAALPVELDTQLPAVESMTASGDKIVIIFDSQLDETNLPENDAFSVQVNGEVRDVTELSVEGTQVTLTLKSALKTGDSVQVGYTDPTAGDDANAIQDIAGNDAESFISGKVADGYVRGAQIWIDTDNDGKEDYNTGLVTDAEGNFFLPTGLPQGPIIAKGGVNIDTGVPNTMALKAPAGSTTINPLTTLVQAVIEKQVAENPGTVVDATLIAGASKSVADSLGLILSQQGASLTNYDPIATGNVAVQKVAAQVATVVILVADKDAAAGDTVIGNLVNEMKDAGSRNESVNLADAGILNKVLTNTAAATDADQQKAIVEAAGDIGNAKDLTEVTKAQSKHLDKIAPDAPTLEVAEISNVATPTVRIEFDTKAKDGTAAVLGDILKLRDAGDVLTSVTLTAEHLAAGFVELEAPSLAEGEHRLDAILVDKAGNQSSGSAASEVLVDTLAPDAATIDMVAGDNIINASEQAAVISGSAEALATLSLTLGGNIRTVDVDAEGHWSYQLTDADLAAMGQGNEMIGVQVTDIAGNQSDVTLQQITVDTLAPNLTISSDATELKAGESAVITFTFSETPAEFTAEDLVVTGGTLSNLAVDSSNDTVYTATFTPTADLASGSATISVAAGAYGDLAGNAGAEATSPSLSLDTLAPSLDITTDVTSLKAGETATITFSFSEAPDAFTAEDIVTSGGTLSGLAVSSDDDKVYTAIFTPTPNLASGTASISVAEYSDLAGNAGAAASAPSLSLDTLAPAVLPVSPQNLGQSLGLSANLKLAASESIDKGTGFISLLNADGTLVERIDVNSLQVSITGTDANTEISIDPSADLVKDQVYYVQVDAGALVDLAGNDWAGIGDDNSWTFTGAGATVTINPVAQAPVNAEDASEVITVTGLLQGESELVAAFDVNDLVVELSANAMPPMTLNTNLAYDPDTGKWSVDIPAGTLAGTADYTLSATFTGTSGVVEGIVGSGQQQVSVDTLLPTVSDISLSGHDEQTHAALNEGDTVTAKVTLSEAVTVTGSPQLALNIGGQLVQAIYESGSGTSELLFSYTLTSDLADADGISIDADSLALNGGTLTDVAGNPAQLTHEAVADNAGFTVDNTAPAAPELSSQAGDITNHNTISFTLTAEAGSKVDIYNGAERLGQAVEGANGQFSFTTDVLVDGQHGFTAQATDAAGNISQASQAVQVTIDTLAPEVPVIDTTAPAVTNNNTITLSLTAEAGSKVDIYSGEDLLGQAEEGESGQFSFTTEVLEDGDHSFTAVATDAAGNNSLTSAPLAFEVDTTAPDAPEFQAGDSLTNNNIITLNLTAEAGSIVVVYHGDTLLGNAQEGDIAGQFSFTTEVQEDGEHSFTAKATDAAGNVSELTQSDVVIVDTVAPGTPIIQFDSSVSTGVSRQELLNGVTTPVNINGTGAVVGDTLELLMDGEVYDTVQLTQQHVDAGEYNFVMQASEEELQAGTLADGYYAFSARLIDQAGNRGAAVESTLELDTQVPAATTERQPIEVESELNGRYDAGDRLTFYFSERIYSAESIIPNSFGEGAEVLFPGENDHPETLTVVLGSNPTLKAGDKIYIAAGTLQDQAGNSNTQPISFVAPEIPMEMTIFVRDLLGNQHEVTISDLPASDGWTQGAYVTSRFQTAAVVFEGRDGTQDFKELRIVDLHTGEVLAGTSLSSEQFLLPSAGVEPILHIGLVIDDKVQVATYPYGLDATDISLFIPLNTNTFVKPFTLKPESNSHEIISYIPVTESGRGYLLFSEHSYSNGIFGFSSGYDFYYNFLYSLIDSGVGDYSVFTKDLIIPHSLPDTYRIEGLVHVKDVLWLHALMKGEGNEGYVNLYYTYDSADRAWLPVGEDDYWDAWELVHAPYSVIRVGDYTLDMLDLVPTGASVWVHPEDVTSVGENRYLARIEVELNDGTIDYEHWVLFDATQQTIIAEKAFDTDTGLGMRYLYSEDDAVYFQQLNAIVEAGQIVGQGDPALSVHRVAHGYIEAALNGSAETLASSGNQLASFTRAELSDGTITADQIVWLEDYVPLSATTEAAVVISGVGTPDDDASSAFVHLVDDNGEVSISHPLPAELDDIHIDPDHGIFLLTEEDEDYSPHAYHLDTETGNLSEFPADLWHFTENQMVWVKDNIPLSTITEAALIISAVGTPEEVSGTFAHLFNDNGDLIVIHQFPSELHDIHIDPGHGVFLMTQKDQDVQAHAYHLDTVTGQLSEFPVVQWSGLLEGDLSFEYVVNENNGLEHVVEGTPLDDTFIIHGNADVTGGEGQDVFSIQEPGSDLGLTLQDFTTGIDTVDIGALLEDMGYTAITTETISKNHHASIWPQSSDDVQSLIDANDDSLDNVVGMIYRDAETYAAYKGGSEDNPNALADVTTVFDDDMATIVISPSNWSIWSNSINLQVEYDANNFKFDSVNMVGSGSQHIQASTSEFYDVGVANLSLSLTNWQNEGTFQLKFIPKDAAGTTFDATINSVSINGSSGALEVPTAFLSGIDGLGNSGYLTLFTDTNSLAGEFSIETVDIALGAQSTGFELGDLSAQLPSAVLSV